MPKTTQKNNVLFVGMVSKNKLWKIVAINNNFVEIAANQKTLSNEKTVKFVTHAAEALMEN